MELGIDSLVAVDLRAWFVNELGVDMPILKILGGATIIDLVTDAVARLPVAMLPAVVVEAKEEYAKDSQTVLVPNGLGGHDLVSAVSDAVLHPDSVSHVLEAEDVDVPSTSPHPQRHSKNVSFDSTSSGHSSSDQATFSRPHSPALSYSSSAPDHDAMVQLLRSALDIHTSDQPGQPKQDVEHGSDGETISPSFSEEQVFTPESEIMESNCMVLLKDEDVQVMALATDDLKSGGEVDVVDIQDSPLPPEENISSTNAGEESSQSPMEILKTAIINSASTSAQETGTIIIEDITPIVATVPAQRTVASVPDITADNAIPQMQPSQAENLNNATAV